MVRDTAESAQQHAAARDERSEPWQTVHLRLDLGLCPRAPLRVKRKRLAQLHYLLAYLAQNRGIIAIEQCFGDPVPDLPHLSFLHPAGG